MQVRVHIDYTELLNLIKQLPVRQIARLKQDVNAIPIASHHGPTRIADLRGRVSKMSETDIDGQLSDLRNEWNSTFF